MNRDLLRQTAGPAVIPRLDSPRDVDVVRLAQRPEVPRLSVVVPSFNTARFIGDTVASLLGQTMADLEVIVVDDGSTDDSVQRLLAIDDERLTLVRQANRGLAGARNTGIILARAPFIGLCDSDDVWHARKAELHLERMKHAPDVGITFSLSTYLEENGAPTGQILGTTCAEPTLRQLLRRNHLGNGSTAIVRRACFEQVGLFDESLRSVEDWEIWIRIAARTPFRFVRIAAPLTGYRMRPDSLMQSYETYLQCARSAVARFAENVPGFAARHAQRAYAETLRIASRKSYAAGNVTASRRYLLEALRRSPAILVQDSRALAMALIHLGGAVLPRRAEQVPYRLMQRVMRPLYRRAMTYGAVATWPQMGDRS